MESRMNNNETRPWVRKAVVIACVLNVIALLLIVLSIIKFTPLTMIASVSVSGGLMGLAILIYIVIVVRDLHQEGIL